MRIDFIILRFAPMNRLHRESLTQDKSEAFLAPQVGQPLPREHTLNADDQSLSLGSNQPQKCLRRRRQLFVHEFGALLIENTDVHRLRV